MRNVTIATTSFLVEDHEHTLEMNFEKCILYVKEARKKSADIICFPETVLTTNAHPDLQQAGEKFPGMFTNFFCNLAREYKINLIAPYLVFGGRKMYSQATVIDRKGNVAGYYRKVQPNYAELDYITPGDKLPVFKMDFGRIAIMLCMDIYFPEIARIYALKKSDIIFWPTITHGPTQEALLTQIKSRAIENSITIVESNLAGHPPYAPYAGRHYPATARIVDHNGDIIAQTGRRHGVAVAEVDLDEVHLTSRCVLKREPDHMREDLQSLIRMDLYAKEYAKLAKRR